LVASTIDPGQLVAEILELRRSGGERDTDVDALGRLQSVGTSVINSE
jgi:hypothetical protein